MLIDEKIKECEYAYTKCFSEFYEDEKIIRFRDNKIKDMHNHNFTFIKKQIDETKLIAIIEEEIPLRLIEKGDFCKFMFNDYGITATLSNINYKPEISLNGYYSFDISKFSKLKVNSNCEIKKVTSPKMLENILAFELQLDEERLGRDFCTRKCNRRIEEYISDKNINSYICYQNGQIIGSCELFMNNGVAKIENFIVLPAFQRKGYGTTILKALIDIAISEVSKIIYLVTDEEDTAKEMYKKLGFSKTGERTDLMFKL